jgi:hypothetical protein
MTDKVKLQQGLADEDYCATIKPLEKTCGVEVKARAVS